MSETVIGDFSRGEDYGNKQITSQVRKLFKDTEVLVFPLVLTHLKPAELWQEFLELYSGYEDRLKDNPNYPIYELVRFLDKSYTSTTIITLEVGTPEEFSPKSGCFNSGCSVFLLRTLKEFLQAFEKYTQCAHNSDRFSSQFQSENYLTELMTQILQFLENQFSARLAKADRNKTVKITIIDIME